MIWIAEDSQLGSGYPQATNILGAQGSHKSREHHVATKIQLILVAALEFMHLTSYNQF